MYDIEKEKIIEFIYSIKNKDELQLSVNYGIFAILIKDLFNIGELVAIVKVLKPEEVQYVMLRVGDKYYDSQGEWTKDEIMSCQKNGYGIVEIDENSIEKSTVSNMTVAELVSMLKF